MKNRQIFLGLLTAALIGAAVFGSRGKKEETQKISTTTSRPPSLIDATRFLDRPEFVRVWNQKPEPIQGKIIAGTVNHHVLASDLLAHFFLTLAANRPDARRLVILSPDHFYAGRAQVSTHVRPYQTPDGVVNIDTEAIAQLTGSGYVTEEDGEMYEKEHGIGALVPFIKRALPEVELIPLSVKGNADLANVEKLVGLLQAFDDGKTVFIVSADMSHYLPKNQAEKNDLQTKKWLEEEDIAQMSRAKDTHTDSGRQFVAVFSWLKAKHPQAAFQLLDEGISSDYVPDTQNTTTYLNGFWREIP